ncbi:hypothetical protein [Pseudomonas putida]|uniref:hypothetical protein n=1 Tax=Pseudomonas putida TaxID=303 RepID=UPI0021177F1E|nr:hypothetical protein [Pseudomonas putida]
MNVPGNCVLAALMAWVASPKATRIRFIRNKSRRWHCIWERGGKAFEFYAPGRSRMPYWRNALYLGHSREIGVPLAATDTESVMRLLKDNVRLEAENRALRSTCERAHACMSRWAGGYKFDADGPAGQIQGELYDAYRPGARKGLSELKLFLGKRSG